MKLSTKARYGLRAMLELSERYGTGPTQAKTVAQRQGISPKYLEHLLTSLKANGLVRVARGAHGGYELSRAPEAISLGDVVRALEGSLDLVECVTDPSVCPRAKTCVTRDVWVAMKDAMERVLNSATMGQLIQSQESKRRSAGADFMYSI